MSERKIQQLQQYGPQQTENSDIRVEETIAKSRSVVEQGLLYVGIPAITLYPLGLVTLSIQLCLDPSFPQCDFATVWTSVSLISETAVIGTGIYFAYLSLIASLLGMGVASLTLALFRRSRRARREKRSKHDEPPILKILREGFKTLGRKHWWNTYLLILLPIAILMGSNGILFDEDPDVWYLAGFVLLNIGGGVFLAYMRAHRGEGSFPTGLVPAYVVVVFAASLCLAALTPPDLPVVEIEAEATGASSDTSGTPGKEMFVFLAQNGPYWYVYNQDGLFSLQIEKAEFVGSNPFIDPST